MDWDSIKSRFGGEWYDEWWCSTFSWFALQEGGHCDWWYKEYHQEFFRDINVGWLKMYPEPVKEKLSLKDYIQKLANEIRLVY